MSGKSHRKQWAAAGTEHPPLAPLTDLHVRDSRAEREAGVEGRASEGVLPLRAPTAGSFIRTPRGSSQVTQKMHSAGGVQQLQDRKQQKIEIQMKFFIKNCEVGKRTQKKPILTISRILFQKFWCLLHRILRSIPTKPSRQRNGGVCSPTGNCWLGKWCWLAAYPRGAGSPQLAKIPCPKGNLTTNVGGEAKNFWRIGHFGGFLLTPRWKGIHARNNQSL